MSRINRFWHNKSTCGESPTLAEFKNVFGFVTRLSVAIKRLNFDSWLTKITKSVNTKIRGYVDREQAVASVDPRWIKTRDDKAEEHTVTMF